MQVITPVSMVLFIGLLSSSPNADPIPAFDWAKLSSLSSHAAVVEVLSDEAWSTLGETDSSTPLGHVSVRVKRRIRGADLPDSVTVSLTESYHPFAGVAALRKGVSVLAFLSRLPDNAAWTLSDPYYGLFRVCSERVDTGFAEDLREATLDELRKSLDDSNPVVVQAALDALAAFRDSSATGKALLLSRSGNAKIVTHALMFRFAVGDAKGLANAVRMIEGESGLTGQEKTVLGWSITDAEDLIPVSALNDLLLNSTSSLLRQVSATILAQRGDTSSFEALTSGLLDTNRETQYRCVVGLSRITGRSGPGHKEFFANPDTVLLEWRNWWESDRGRR